MSMSERVSGCGRNEKPADCAISQACCMKAIRIWMCIQAGVGYCSSFGADGIFSRFSKHGLPHQVYSSAA